MLTTVRHDDSNGLHIEYGGRVFRSIAPTQFDDGDEVRVSSATPYSDKPTAHIVVRSADGQIVEDWRESDVEPGPGWLWQK